MGWYGSIRARRAKKDRSFTVRGCAHVGQLSNALLTLMVALAAGLDVGLMALTRRTPSGGDRLLALQTRRSPTG